MTATADDTNIVFDLQVRVHPQGAPISLQEDWQLLSREESDVPSVTLQHATVPVRVQVCTRADGTPVLVRWLEITNTGTESLAITDVSPWAGCLWDGGGEVTVGRALQWKPFGEGWFGWEALQHGVTRYEHTEGLAFDDACFIAHNKAVGEYVFAKLAWPVNWFMEFQHDAELTFRMGPLSAEALRVVAPGETVRTPAIHLGRTRGNLDTAVQAMHRHIRQSVFPPRPAEQRFLVQYLYPEDQGLSVYRGAECNEVNVQRLTDVAAEAGAELFILDGPTWAEGYGNWTPKAEGFPNGLAPLVEYAHQRGLRFGVYAEPEGGRGDWSGTAAYQQHPKWFGPRNHDWPGVNFLNLAREGAAAYMEAELHTLIAENQLDIYRHDQNGCFGGEGSVTERDGFIENDYWRHYEAFNAITERLAAKYPEVIFQQASGGGSRLDLGTVARWHEHYTSDCAYFPRMFRMHCGLSLYLPPEILVSPHGMADDLPDLETTLRGVYLLGQTPMLFNKILPKRVEEFTPAQRTLFRKYANLYKSFIRPLLGETLLYHHAPIDAQHGVEDGEWLALEFINPERTRGWATVIHLERTAGAYHFVPRGLDPQRTYTITRDNTGEIIHLDGATALRQGFAVQITADRCSEVLFFTCEE